MSKQSGELITKGARWFPGAAPTDCNLETSVQ